MSYKITKNVVSICVKSYIVDSSTILKRKKGNFSKDTPKINILGSSPQYEDKYFCVLLVNKLVQTIVKRYVCAKFDENHRSKINLVKIWPTSPVERIDIYKYI